MFASTHWTNTENASSQIHHSISERKERIQKHKSTLELRNKYVNKVISDKTIMFSSQAQR